RQRRAVRSDERGGASVTADGCVAWGGGDTGHRRLMPATDAGGSWCARGSGRGQSRPAIPVDCAVVGDWHDGAGAGARRRQGTTNVVRVYVMAVNSPVQLVTPLDDISDEELMGLLAAGREDALGSLHGRYAPLMFGLAARSLDHAAAEEIV